MDGDWKGLHLKLVNKILLNYYIPDFETVRDIREKLCYISGSTGSSGSNRSRRTNNVKVPISLVFNFSLL
ncbi:hypothetical protein CsSME_00050761 [Camellia sinensis var. sinensis]